MRVTDVCMNVLCAVCVTFESFVVIGDRDFITVRRDPYFVRYFSRETLCILVGQLIFCEKSVSSAIML